MTQQLHDMHSHTKHVHGLYSLLPINKNTVMHEPLHQKGRGATAAERRQGKNMEKPSLRVQSGRQKGKTRKGRQHSSIIGKVQEERITCLLFDLKDELKGTIRLSISGG